MPDKIELEVSREERVTMKTENRANTCA